MTDFQARKIQTFLDGTCAIYQVKNSAPRAAKPVPQLIQKPKHPLLRYARRTVGISRFWNAHQQNVSIDRLIRTPRHEDVSTQDVAILENGMQYDIVQVQYPEDVTPPCMDLSLQRRTSNYDINSVP